MFPLVRVGAAVSEDVVTSTRLFAIWYNILHAVSQGRSKTELYLWLLQGTWRI